MTKEAIKQTFLEKKLGLVTANLERHYAGEGKI